MKLNNGKSGIVIIGGGLTGLSAGYALTRAGFRVRVFENDSTVGGLSKTVVKDGFRFDLGGHRFFTRNAGVDSLVKDLMHGELIPVPRKSKIYLKKKYFDYPLKPLNAVFGMGVPTTMNIIADYGIEKLRNLFHKPALVSLEDWVISNFGRTMFTIYFKEYSEKVWGIDCSRISAEWVAQRINGLSLAKAVRNAFFKFSGRGLATLVDRFDYPRLGIGRISDRFKEEIEKKNDVFTDSGVVQINHSGSRIESVVVDNHGRRRIVGGEEFVSSMPITKLVGMLNPAPPGNVAAAASRLKFRDLVVAAVMVDRRRVTDQTWIYIPERRIPFGRIHEPTNWSEQMAPPGKTLLVIEYFSFRGDAVWNEKDERLADITVENLEHLGFLKRHEVLDSVIVRVPKAYPLFEVGYKELCGALHDYLGGFTNLHIAGRSGMFRYYNMDHAIESGLGTAEKIIREAGNKKAELRSEEVVLN